MFIFEF